MSAVRFPSAARPFETVGVLLQKRAGLVPHVALQQDFTVFAGPAHAAERLEPFGQGLQIVGRPHKPPDKRHGFAAAALAVAHHAQILSGGRQGFSRFGFLVLILKIGGRGIHHAYGTFLAHKVTIKKSPLRFSQRAGARDRTRTDTGLTPLVFETNASTNSATRAKSGCKGNAKKS